MMFLHANRVRNQTTFARRQECFLSILLLPLALVPAVPLLLDNRPDLAISAVADDQGGTRVTVHGQASSELAAALDAYLGSLPRLTLENLGSGPQG